MTLYKSIFAAAFVISMAQNSIADIYKCKKPDGTFVFQDKYCAEKTGEQLIAKPHPKLCFSITNSTGRTFEAQDFWTDKQNDDSLFHIQIEGKKTAFLPEKIQSIKITEQKKACALVQLVNNARESFDGTVCDGFHYLTDKGEDSLAVTELDSIKACQSKTHADGFWTLAQKKYLLQSAYVGYSKKSNQIKVLVFPFVFTKEEEEAMLNRHDTNTLLNGKSDRNAFGIILKLKEDVAEPEIADVTQFQALVIDSKTTRVRSYDQNWRSAFNLKKLEIRKSEQGGMAEISWTLNDSEQQAEVNVSAVVVEEN